MAVNRSSRYHGENLTAGDLSRPQTAKFTEYIRMCLYEATFAFVVTLDRATVDSSVQLRQHEHGAALCTLTDDERTDGYEQ
jgi:hypothetical protein